MFDLDAHIGMHADALKLRSQRAELIARNLANADTPGFEARDFDFREALSAVRSGGRAAAEPHLMYRVPVAPSVDGNTVDVQIEQAAFAENTVKYQVTLQFVNSKLRGLMTALTGQ